jgi:hypothetical protein
MEPRKIRTLILGRNDFNPIVEEIPFDYADKMLMQFPLVDLDNSHLDPGDRVYGNFYIPIYAPTHKALLVPMFHVAYLNVLNNPVKEEELMGHVIDHLDQIGQNIFKTLSKAINLGKETGDIVKISNIFETLFFWVVGREFFMRETTPLVLSPYAAKSSKTPISYFGSYNDSVLSLMLYILSINVDRERAMYALAEWVHKISRQYKTKAVYGDYDNFASEKYLYNNYKTEIFDFEETILKEITENLVTGDIDYDPRAPIFRGLLTQEHRFLYALEAAVKSLAIYYIPDKKEFIVAPDVDLFYTFYKKDENKNSYLPVYANEYEEVVKLFLNSVEPKLHDWAEGFEQVMKMLPQEE